MNDHPPEYEYRVADLHDSTFSHPCGDDHEFAMIAAQRARALGRFGAQIQRRFMGPWHPVSDGDEAPAADRRLAVFDVVVSPPGPGPGGGEGIGMDVYYRGLRGVHEITPLIGTTSTRVEFDLDNPAPEPF